MGDGDDISKELGGRSSSSLHCSSGPNATNAETRMNFASVDAISELVWSPRKGLSLRCADFSFTRKPKLLSPNFFDIGQPNMAIHSNSTSIEQQQEEETGIHVNVQLRTRDQVNQVCSEKSNQMTRPLSGIGGSVEDIKPEIDEMVVDKIETSDGRECPEAGCSKRSSDSLGAIGGKTEALLANEKLRLDSGESQEEPSNNHGVKEEENKMNSRVDHSESMDENNLSTLAVVACEGKEEYLPEDETDVEKAGPSSSYRRRCAKEKGKEKALSDGNFDENDADDESFGSVESCNSAGLLSRGKKRPGFKQQLILGSKRLKTLSQEQEYLGSTSKLKQDSSFMNWISNMTKGIWKGNEEDNSPFVALTTTSNADAQVNAIVDQQALSPFCLMHDSKGGNTGFQSFFKSIYCPTKRSQDAAEMDFTNDANAASLQELPWIPEQCDITKGDHLSSSGNGIGPVAELNVSSEKVDCNQTSETFSTEHKQKEKESNISLLSLSKAKPNEEPKTCGEADGKVSQCLTNRKSGPESLWISRFSSKSSVPQKKVGEMVKGANDSASDGAKNRDSQKMLADNNVLIPSNSLDGFDKPKTALPIVSSLRIDSSDAVASLFARRLEAIKHIMPSGSLAENEEEGQINLICFYCGKKDHCLRDCLKVTDTELRDLVLNISAWNERKEASGLCIRCFQLSHWAATCPNTPLYSSGAEDRAVKHALAFTSGTKLPSSSFTDIPKAVFDTVQVLRLTRTDVLKWINTKKSVSGLEGFFLRLRLGKWQEGLGGTGYSVARIDVDTKGQSSRRNSDNNTISVKVKGMTCLVESQFISNHDFLEEELKAWWQNAGRSGGDSIPPAEELSRKIKQRKMLGF